MTTDALIARIIGPYLAKPSKQEFDFFVKDWVRRKDKSERFGQSFLSRYSVNGYKNKELFFASNSKAFLVLSNFVNFGELKLLPAAT